MPLGIPIRFSCDISCDGRVVVMIRIIDIVSIIVNRILIIIRVILIIMRTTIVIMAILKIMRGISVTNVILVIFTKTQALSYQKDRKNKCKYACGLMTETDTHTPRFVVYEILHHRHP